MQQRTEVELIEDVLGDVLAEEWQQGDEQNDKGGEGEQPRHEHLEVLFCAIEPAMALIAARFGVEHSQAWDLGSSQPTEPAGVPCCERWNCG